MILKKLQLKNFRCFKELSVDLHPRLNVFVANNGKGKTAILDAIAVGLGAVLTHLPEVKGINFRTNDRWQNEKMKQAPYVRVMLETTDAISWVRTEKRDQSKETLQEIPPDKKLAELHQFLENIINSIQASLHIQSDFKFDRKDNIQLPVMVYYGTDRASRSSSSVPRDFKKTFNRFKALEDAMKPSTRVDFMV